MHIRLKSLAIISLAALAACQSVQDSGGGAKRAPTALAGTSWQLMTLQSSSGATGTVHPDDPTKYELTFGTDGRVAARLDCNRGSAAYNLASTEKDKGAINFGPMVMTRAMCPAGSLDTRVGRELGFVRSYLLNGDRLTLVMMADGGNQVWQRRP